VALGGDVMIELEQGTADALSVPTSRSSIATAPPSGASSCLSDRLTRLARRAPLSLSAVRGSGLLVFTAPREPDQFAAQLHAR